MLRKNFPGRRAQRYVEAVSRQAVRLKRSGYEQLMLLTSRPGESKREIARLRRRDA